MNKSTHFDMNLPETVDAYNVSHMNQNTEIIDNKMHELEQGLSDGSVTKLGTATKGANKQVMFLNNGIPEEGYDFSNTIIIEQNVEVPTSAWVSDTTFPLYPYKADIVIGNVTTDYVPDVTFAPEEIAEGIYCPVASSGTNKVTIYASNVPAAAITLLSIVCRKEV